MSTSGNVVEHARTSITTSPGPATGSSTSSTVSDSGGPYAWHRTARMAAADVPPLGRPRPPAGRSGLRRLGRLLETGPERLVVVAERPQRGAAEAGGQRPRPPLERTVPVHVADLSGLGAAGRPAGDGELVAE